MAVHHDYVGRKEQAITFAKKTLYQVPDESDDRKKLQQHLTMWIDELEY